MDDNESKVGTYQVVERNGEFILGMWVVRYIKMIWFKKPQRTIVFEYLACNDKPWGCHYSDVVPPPLPPFKTLKGASDYAKELMSKSTKEIIFHDIQN